jgi:hypothetical protein
MRMRERERAWVAEVVAGGTTAVGVTVEMGLVAEVGREGGVDWGGRAGPGGKNSGRVSWRRDIFRERSNERRAG